MVDSGEERRQEALKLCAKYLAYSWSSLEPDRIQIHDQLGGHSNLKFRFTLPDGCSDRFSDVLVRFYGSPLVGSGNTHKFMSETEEAVIFTLLSIEFNGPKLLGVFPGGRIEEFIKSESISIEDYEGPQIGSFLAKQLARIHNLQMPIPKTTKSLAKISKELFDKYLTTKAVTESNHEFYLNHFKDFNFKNEVKWLFGLSSHISTRIVFVHNDLNVSNIVRRTGQHSSDSDYLLLDYEYGRYSFRWSDIASYFSEVAFNHFEPGQELSYERWPNRDQRLSFIEEYLTEWRSFSSNFDPTLDNSEVLLLEADYGALWIHLIRLLWILAHNDINNQEYNFWDYAMNRFRFYVHFKQVFLKEHSQKLV